MKIRRFTGGAAAFAALALVLTACANTPDDSGDASASATESATETESASTTGGTITVAETNSLTGLNTDSADYNLDFNGKIAYATTSNFYYVNTDLEIVRDESFGVYEVLSEDPLTVKYTVNEGVVWSDGEPIDAGDLLLAWAVGSGHYTGVGPDGVFGYDDEGNTDDISYFAYAGDTGTLALTSFPEVGDDGRSITLTYSEPAADWEIAFAVGMPAHVVATKGGLADEQALVDLLTELAPTAPDATEENAELAAVAAFWNDGYATTTLPSDPELYLSSGPYILSDVVEEQSVTLVPNDAYTGDHTPKLDSIIVRSIGDATAAVQALQNGEVDVISPQSSADTLAALEALSGVTVHQGDQLSYDHIDLTFDNGGPFDPATYGGDAATAQLVREAFLLSIPRQAILDAIVTPQKPDAEVLNSQLFVSSQAPYASTVESNNSDLYPVEGDVEAAKAKLAEAGVTNPTVRILYNINNPNRVNAYTLIASAATEAGFTVVDNGDAAWGSLLGSGSYDASIFGWISSGVGNTSLGQIFATGGGGNYSGYSNANVDALAETLQVTLDADEQVAIQAEADGYLFEDAYGLPLFQSPGVDAVSDRVVGITEFHPTQRGVFWNVWEWAVNDG